MPWRERNEAYGFIRMCRKGRKVIFSGGGESALPNRSVPGRKYGKDRKGAKSAGGSQDTGAKSATKKGSRAAAFGIVDSHRPDYRFVLYVAVPANVAASAALTLLSAFLKDMESNL